MIGGGLASIALKILIFTFFIMQLLAVVMYRDPQLSKFENIESRANMDEPMNLATNNLLFYFGLMSLKGVPLQQDPRYGTFRLAMLGLDVNEEGHWIQLPPIDVPIKEVDMSNDETAKKILYFYENMPFGVYSADSSLLEVFGTVDDAPAQSIMLQFVPCDVSGAVECATSSEIQAYENETAFWMMSSYNSIDMEAVLPIEDTLK